MGDDDKLLHRNICDFLSLSPQSTRFAMEVKEIEAFINGAAEEAAKAMINDRQDLLKVNFWRGILTGFDSVMTFINKKPQESTVNDVDSTEH
jgi:hypothetical protein